MTRGNHRRENESEREGGERERNGQKERAWKTKKNEEIVSQFYREKALERDKDKNIDRACKRNNPKEKKDLRHTGTKKG